MSSPVEMDISAVDLIESVINRIDFLADMMIPMRAEEFVLSESGCCGFLTILREISDDLGRIQAGGRMSAEG